MLSAVNTFLNLGVMAIYPHKARWIAVQIAPSLTLARGTILGEIQLNDTYSIATGSQASGTFTLSFGGQTTATIAYNASAATVQTAFLALSSVGAGNATVALASGTPGTNAVYTLTLTGTLGYKANGAVTANFASLATPGNASITQATVGHTLGTYKAYNSGNSDGSQVARGILQYDVVTDASGNITLGSQAGGMQYQQTYQSVPMFVSGDFYLQDLTGLDSTAVSVLGRIVEGSLTVGTGIFRMA